MNIAINTTLAAIAQTSSDGLHRPSDGGTGCILQASGTADSFGGKDDDMREGDLPQKGIEAMDAAAVVAGRVRARLQNALRPKEARTPEESKAHGRDLREKVPLESHGDWVPTPDRPDPVALLKEQGKSRLQDLLPVRYERMAASAFTFYRGGALVMAWDLSKTPSTGIEVQACGDAHISNFGLFNSPERRTVFDINDFDETLPGPWEWDVKRLAASVEICGRDRGFPEADRADMVLSCVQGYRQAMREFAKMGNLDVWYAHMDVDTLQERFADQMPKKTRKAAEKTVEKAKGKDSTRAIAKLTEVVDGKLRVVSDPPIVVPMRDIVAQAGFTNAQQERSIDVAKLVGRILSEYRLTLPPDKRRLVEQYEGVDIARKVVGVGSVGTRAWIVVMRGAGNDDPLVLQVKEAQESVLERFVGKSAFHEHGERVVRGQQAMQTASDMLLGWCRLPGEDGHLKDYYVRQLWDGKGSIDLDRPSCKGLVELSRACGWTLAHAHARSGDRFAIASYMGKKDVFDQAIARFARAYADQNERDYERFMQAVEAGELPCASMEDRG